MHIATICGSLRKASFNRMLLNAAEEAAPASLQFEDAPIGDLPLFSQDLEESPPVAVTAFRDTIARADGVLVASPEYNYGVPGVLKNAIDWGSRPYSKGVLIGKPSGVIGASVGMGGTIRMQLQLRTTFQYLNSPCMMMPEILVPTAQDKFSDGRLTDPATLDFLTKYMAAFATWIERKG